MWREINWFLWWFEKLRLPTKTKKVLITRVDFVNWKYNKVGLLLRDRFVGNVDFLRIVTQCTRFFMRFLQYTITWLILWALCVLKLAFKTNIFKPTIRFSMNTFLGWFFYITYSRNMLQCIHRCRYCIHMNNCMIKYPTMCKGE